MPGREGERFPESAPARESEGQKLRFALLRSIKVDEVLRLLDSLQLTAKHPVSTPANWKPGGDVIIAPAVSDDDAKGKFPAGWKTLKPYLRVTAQPQ
jgi:hypothetical protein